MKVFDALNSKTQGFGSRPLGEPWHLVALLIWLALLPSALDWEVVAMGAIGCLLFTSQTRRKKKAPSKLAPEELHSSSKRPVHRFSPKRAHRAPPVSSSPPMQMRHEMPVKSANVFPPDMIDAEVRTLQALEVYKEVSGVPAGDLSKEKLLPAPVPSTSLKGLSSNLLGHASLPDGLASRIDEVLRASLPEIQIFHFSRTSGADGHARPQLQVMIFMPSDVATGSPIQVRFERGQHRSKDSGKSSPGVLSGEKLQKCVLRHCLGLLVDQGFKYRRSAFQAESPAVLMLAPDEYKDGKGNVGIEMSVNNPLPFLNAALVCEASKVDVRASTFITSVQRWADARAIAHVGYGPLNMYAWTHLAIFYLQTEAPHRMPPLSGKPLGSQHQPPRTEQPPPLNASLFRGFFKFLCEESLWTGSVFLRGSSPQGNEMLICDALRPDVDIGVQLRTHEHLIARIKTEAVTALRHFATSGTVADLLAAPNVQAGLQVHPSWNFHTWATVGGHDGVQTVQQQTPEVGLSEHLKQLEDSELLKQEEESWFDEADPAPTSTDQHRSNQTRPGISKGRLSSYLLIGVSALPIIYRIGSLVLTLDR